MFSVIKTIKAATNFKALVKTQKILTNMLAEYEISHVSIMLATYVQQRRSFVCNVCSEIETVLKQKNLSYSKHDPKIVRRTICENEIPNKPNTALILSGRYPELRRHTVSSEGWQKRYSDLLFNAVAVGLISARERANKIKK